jgi:hypothetical protein
VAAGLGAGPKPAHAGNELFTTLGQVIDATTGMQVGTLPRPNSYVAHAVLADAARGRVYLWTSVDTREYILSYDMLTRELLALAPVYPGPGFGSASFPRMILWGTEGVALTNGTHLIVLSGPFFSTYRGEPTL